ncbi:putative ankyrin repeat protein [Chloropicon roscoffensis]|uniref:Ankyrin repeat protein n=1 Tax=Chloropicon roscoffensis TaxID=1461544 RepID=A0AAX4PJY9_9CHLO
MAKRTKADEEEARLVRRREELVRLLGRARKGKDSARAKKELVTSCADLEAKNRKLLEKLPPELWQKIVDQYLHQNDLLALAMTCRFFREKQKDLGKKMETDLTSDHLCDLLKSGRMPSHSLGWFQWVCNTFEIPPGCMLQASERVKGAVYEGDLLNYAAFQGSVEILRWLMEEKGWEPSQDTGWWAGMGGSVKILEYLRGRGYKFKEACEGAAFGGHLDVLKFLRGLDPPCPWDVWTCSHAADGGHLEVLKWLRAQNPPCPWNENVCYEAAGKGHLEILKWAFSQNPPCEDDYYYGCAIAAGGGHLEVLKFLRGKDPPCPWSRSECREVASHKGHDHIVEWVDQHEDESDVEY